ncbi:MAG: glycosyl hydrolase family 17 protein [Alphaproteobacteria bacterium]
MKTVSKPASLSVVLGIWILASGLALLAWSRLGAPVAMVDIETGRLPCVSYAPFRDGQSPFVESFVVPVWQIEEDLRLLQTYTNCVRTYSVDQGLKEVPRVARELGMKVLLGAWIGRDHKKNAIEIARLIELARAYPDSVRAVIVGNEVLLRRELPAEDLARLIREVKQAVPMPVTYADVWEFWLKNPVVGTAADFITIHILPYWEDDPIEIGGAIEHVAATWRRIAAAFPGKRIMVGEAGWPSEGRMREGALPSIVNQARFVRETVSIATRENIDINVIEAYDQAWKRASEGTVGGHWGVFTTDRKPKYPLTGPVIENGAWPWYALASVVIALGTLVFVRTMGARLAIGRWFGLAFAIEIGASALVWQARHAVLASVSTLEWIVELGLLGLAVACGMVGLVGLIKAPADGREPPVLSAHGVIDCLRRRASAELARLPGALGLLRLLVAIAAAATVLCFIFDPRYRDFPTPIYVVPALAFAALAWRVRPRGPEPGEERLLATLIAVGALVVVVKEGLENWQALAFGATMLVVAASLRGGLYLRRRI